MREILVILKTGLLDGLTPCSFSIIIYFMALFLLVQYTRKEKWVIGFLFIGAIFLTFYFLELGRFEGFRSLGIFDILSSSIYRLAAFLGIVFGLVNLYDWGVYKKFHSADKMILKFPAILRRQEGKNLFFWIKLVVTTTLAGFIFAMVGSVCRGPIYFSTLVSLFASGNIRIKLIAYSFLYNIMSLLPLVMVFGIVQSEKFNQIAHQYIVKVKIISGALFLAFGLGLLYMFH